jgi:hypothetical protein
MNFFYKNKNYKKIKAKKKGKNHFMVCGQFGVPSSNLHRARRGKYQTNQGNKTDANVKQ